MLPSECIGDISYLTIFDQNTFQSGVTPSNLCILVLIKIISNIYGSPINSPPTIKGRTDFFVDEAIMLVT